MEKRSISGKDILRMDGLLPPTKRLPVCDAVSSTSQKKKDKKWSIGGILKRISSIRDYDSSSNEEEMVYCKREPKNCLTFNQKVDGSCLRPIRKPLERRSNKCNQTSTAVETVSQSPDTITVQRDSMHSRSSDGSLDSIRRKTRKKKLKERTLATRGFTCLDSSSDEDSRKSCNSLTRENGDSTQGSQKNSFCNRKSRAARTERYIKRLSKDEGHGPTGSLSDISNKRNSLDFVDASQRSSIIDANGSFRPPVHPRRPATQSNSYTFPVQRSNENLQEFAVGIPDNQTRSSFAFVKYPADRYITDVNQNNAYAKPASILKKDRTYVNRRSDNYFSNPSTGNVNYAEPCDYAKSYQAVNRSAFPPEPPPRDARSRVFAYGCHSFPHNGKYQPVSKFDDAAHTRGSYANGVSKSPLKNLRPYDSNNEISLCGMTERYPRRPRSLNSGSIQFCNFEECTNNKHKSTGRHVDERSFNETEAMKCQRRNNRNEQLNFNLTEGDRPTSQNSFSTAYKPNKYQRSSPSAFNGSLERFSVRSPSERSAREPLHEADRMSKRDQQEDTGKTTEDDILERKRSSKNLEEALSELEAIYNSLHLGDEDLLDRAERRSMEEFSLKRGKPEDTVVLTSPDSSDRTKDDMAYRRMHPKERPTSLSDVVGQSNISYLMASPILSRKDAVDDYLCTRNYAARRDEPDVTRDDVVYRSIHHAKNTLKVADPQPPFGIPLGPVTTATDSDYLHTRPSKPDHPRSLYIPQCEPDIVTDDLAYRALRKDANTAKNVESKTDVARDTETAFGLKKKRAVRSLSANLYGLINQDRIHLRRESSLRKIDDEIDEVVSIDVKPSPERSECFRRVVSDGELSDYDTRWRTEDSLKNNTDINGNHPASNVNRRKLRVYVAPSTKIHATSDKENVADAEAHSSTSSDTALSSKALGDEFWHDYLRPDANDSPTNNDNESDFTAYTRLCQDLVNLIKGPEEAEIEPNKQEERAAKENVEIDELEDVSKFEEPSILHIQSLGSHYSGLNGTTNPNDNDNIERLTESLTSTDREDSHRTEEDNAFDAYLRLADENVKLIAEAFSSVADHLRDSRSSQKTSLSPPELENESTTSTRSSFIYSPDDANNERFCSLQIIEQSDLVPKEETTTIVDEDHTKTKIDECSGDAHADAQLDLSRAVQDLQLAAASLCEHEKEIEQLEIRLKNKSNDSDVRSTNESVLIAEGEFALESGSLEQERDQEETLVSAGIKMLSDERDPDCEGESTECELICKSYDIDIARSTGMRVSYVTNLITIMITTYSMVLLACFLALLLATVAAS